MIELRELKETDDLSTFRVGLTIRSVPTGPGWQSVGSRPGWQRCPGIRCLFEPMAGFEPATYGLRRPGADLDRGESSRIDEHGKGAEANPRASTRIDEQAFVDRISLDLIGAQARWIATRDRAELRRALLSLLLRIEEV